LVFNLSITPVYANDLLAKEYFLKAAFLYNFSRLINWPTIVFKDHKNSFNLCFIGKDSFANALQSINNKKVFIDHTIRHIKIHRFVTLKNIKHCQIVYISQSEKKQLTTILTYLKQYPILSVSEIQNFADKGGHIRLFLVNNKLKLEINLSVIEHSQLKISSRILTLAKLVSSKESRTP
jgi:hypothetical protein